MERISGPSFSSGSASTAGGGRPETGAVTAVLVEHLGEQACDLPASAGAWPPYEHVNVQIALDHWLAGEGTEHRAVGIAGSRHRLFGLADLLQPGQDRGMAPGSLSKVDRDCGPDDATYSCVQCGLYLVTQGQTRTVILLRGSDQRGPQPNVTVEAVSTDPLAGRRILAEIRALAIEHNVYRGHVVTFGSEPMRQEGGGLLSFRTRPVLDRDELILPDGLLEGIERQVLGVARHRERLLAHGQHLKRGVLLYGAPGVGKTHTIRYLMSQMPGTTVLILTGAALHFIHEACSIAAALAPALVVIEDVDLIAMDRDHYRGNAPLLFAMLNEMDGLRGDADVTFLLTTNRADVLEPALVDRPGRVDHAVELPLPDGRARARLLALYRGGLDLDLVDPERIVERTEGVTASFLKELLRRAALHAAEELPGDAPGSAPDAPLTVTDRHLIAALDDLDDSRNLLTRRLLGAGVAESAG